MILSEARRVYREGNNWTFEIPSYLLSIVNIQENSEVYGYWNREKRYLNSHFQIYLSSIRLPSSLVYCKMKMPDQPGLFSKVMNTLSSKSIGVEKSDDTTLRNQGFVEIVLDLEKSSIKLSELRQILTRLREKRILTNFSKPELLTEFIAVSAFEEVVEGLKIEIHESAKVSFDEKLWEGLNIKIWPEDFYTILSAYAKIPMVSISFYHPDSRLVHVRVGLEDVIGSFSEVLDVIKDFCNLIASDLIRLTKSSGILNGYAELQESCSKKGLQAAIEKCQKVTRGSVKVEELGWEEE